MFRKLNPLLILAILTVLAVAFAGCVAPPVQQTATQPAEAPAQAAAEAVTVRYFTFSAAPDHLDDLDGLVTIFEERNPGITIEVTTAPLRTTSRCSRPTWPAMPPRMSSS